MSHRVRQGDEPVRRDRRLLRAPWIRRDARRHARPLPLGGLRHLLLFRYATHGLRWVRHRGVDRGAAVVEWPGRYRQQLLRRAGAGSHGDRTAAAPHRDLAGRRHDEQLLELRARGRRDAWADVLGTLYPRAGRAGDLGRSRQAAGRLERRARSAAALPGDPVEARSDVAPARADARADAGRLLDARHIRRVVGPRRVRLHRALRPSRRYSHDSFVGVVRPVGWTGRRLLGGHGRAEHLSSAAHARPVESRGDARGGHVLPRGGLRTRERLGGGAVL